MSKQNINPKTGRPYSETPGKPRTPYYDIPGGNFQLIAENDWAQLDARTLGMTPQQALAVEQQFMRTDNLNTGAGYDFPAISTDDMAQMRTQGLGLVGIDYKPPTGTDTGTGNREAPVPAAEKPKQTPRTAADVVAGFGNDFGSMKSSRLSDALRGAQVGIIQKRMDGGANFGMKNAGSAAITPSVRAAAEDAGRSQIDMASIMGGGLETVISPEGITTTATTPMTTSNPASPEDGVSAVPDLHDQSRSIPLQGSGIESIPKPDVSPYTESLLKDYYQNREYTDVFDAATQQWKKVPVNK